ncbi:hypothetical protein ACFFJX_11620 [Pseudarcicella hirudinis]|uniref:hypothetical protein n=1 Tax=Pseudarcicella hirudinis TaxID=1079859 RepID=UPI0035E7C359
MNYLNFNVEDFLLDQKFLDWVKRGQDDSFWQEFQLKFPEKKAEMESQNCHSGGVRSFLYRTWSGGQECDVGEYSGSDE